MELSKVTIEDLYELVNNTLTGGWSIKKFTNNISLDIDDSETDTYIDMEIDKSDKKVDVSFVYFVGDEAYFDEGKSFYSLEELLSSLERINHITNLTLDEILIETNYSELHGSKGIL